METIASISPKKFREQEMEAARAEARELAGKEPTYYGQWSFREYFHDRLILNGIIGAILLWIILSIVSTLFMPGENFFMNLGVGLGMILALYGGVGFISSMILSVLAAFLAGSADDGVFAAGFVWIPWLVASATTLLTAPIVCVWGMIQNIRANAWSIRHNKKLIDAEAAATARVAEYEKAFVEQAGERAHLFSALEVTKAICNKIKDRFIKTIKVTPRPIDERMVTDVYTYEVYPDGVKIHRGVIKFEEYQCKNLPDDLTMAAYGYAVADEVIACIMSEMKKDPSGTDYEISKAYSYDEAGALKVLLTYSAKNGNYEELYEWGAPIAEFSGKE